MNSKRQNIMNNQKTQKMSLYNQQIQHNNQTYYNENTQNYSSYYYNNNYNRDEVDRITYQQEKDQIRSNHLSDDDFAQLKNQNNFPQQTNYISHSNQPFMYSLQNNFQPVYNQFQQIQYGQYDNFNIQYQSNLMRNLIVQINQMTLILNEKMQALGPNETVYIFHEQRKVINRLNLSFQVNCIKPNSQNNHYNQSRNPNQSRYSNKQYNFSYQYNEGQDILHQVIDPYIENFKNFIDSKYLLFTTDKAKQKCKIRVDYVKQYNKLKRQLKQNQYNIKLNQYNIKHNQYIEVINENLTTQQNLYPFYPNQTLNNFIHLVLGLQKFHFKFNSYVKHIQIVNSHKSKRQFNDDVYINAKTQSHYQSILWTVNALKLLNYINAQNKVTRGFQIPHQQQSERNISQVVYFQKYTQLFNDLQIQMLQALQILFQTQEQELSQNQQINKLQIYKFWQNRIVKITKVQVQNKRSNRQNQKHLIDQISQIIGNYFMTNDSFCTIKKPKQIKFYDLIKEKMLTKQQKYAKIQAKNLQTQRKLYILSINSCIDKICMFICSLNGCEQKNQKKNKRSTPKETDKTSLDYIIQMLDQLMKNLINRKIKSYLKDEQMKFQSKHQLEIKKIYLVKGIINIVAFYVSKIVQAAEICNQQKKLFNFHMRQQAASQQIEQIKSLFKSKSFFLTNKTKGSTLFLRQMLNHLQIKDKKQSQKQIDSDTQQTQIITISRVLHQFDSVVESLANMKKNENKINKKQNDKCKQTK